MNIPARHPRIVGCVIAKDEERFLKECLLSLRSICDRVIVVDTGSSDRTRDIAHEKADTVADHPFTNDFSAARNHALALVDQADWILFLDADERLNPDQAKRLRSDLEDQSTDVGAIAMLRYNFFAGGGFYTGREVRAFRYDERIRYERRINESVKPAIARAGLRIGTTDAILTHVGHMRSRAEREAKALRYMSLMQAQLEAQPDDAVLLGYIGLNMRILGRFDEAVEWSDKSLRADKTNPTVWFFRGHVMRSVGRNEDALAAYRTGLQLKPTDTALVNMIGVCQTEAGDLDSADATFAAVQRDDPGLIHAGINRGIVAQAMGDHEQAIEHFERAIAEYPNFLVEEPIGRLEADPLHCLYFETVTGYAGLAQHLAYSRGCVEGWLKPERVSFRGRR
ncbi:glycosyltransferase [Streptomyces puniciscabiei]|uniref:glycosyltransferase n=1 Tax=Streptomyces puniciscabiei TaxID=164348 RepID=UPI00331C5C53